MIKFITMTGSEYELDIENSRIRRITGASPPTSRMGQDGEWREYDSIFPDLPTKNRPLVVAWRFRLEEEQPRIETTVTSPVSYVLGGEA